MGLAKAAIAVCDKSTAMAPTAGAVIEICGAVAEAGVNYLTDMRVFVSCICISNGQTKQRSSVLILLPVVAFSNVVCGRCQLHRTRYIKCLYACVSGVCAYHYTLDVVIFAKAESVKFA